MGITTQSKLLALVDARLCARKASGQHKSAPRSNNCAPDTINFSARTVRKIRQGVRDPWGVPKLTCFHASFFPFCPFWWPPSASPFLTTLSPSSPPRKVLYSVEHRAQRRVWSGAVSGWASPQSSGRKFLPEICVKKRSVKFMQKRRTVSESSKSTQIHTYLHETPQRPEQICTNSRPHALFCELKTGTPPSVAIEASKCLAAESLCKTKIQGEVCARPPDQKTLSYSNNRRINDTVFAKNRKHHSFLGVVPLQNLPCKSLHSK